MGVKGRRVYLKQIKQNMKRTLTHAHRGPGNSPVVPAQAHRGPGHIPVVPAQAHRGPGHSPVVPAHAHRGLGNSPVVPDPASKTHAWGAPVSVFKEILLVSISKSLYLISYKREWVA